MKNRPFWLLLLALTGCAGFSRSCSSCNAESFGSDWVVLQYGYDGKPINCWRLHDVAITNEPQTDGIYWQSTSGHLVHISGWYNRVQVEGGDYVGAAKQLGIDMAWCGEGAYRAPADAAAPAATRAPPPAWTGQGPGPTLP